MDHLTSVRRPDQVIVNKKKKKRTRLIVDFAILADQIVKLKESKKKGKYHDLAWEMKKLWNMKMQVLPVVICILGTVTKNWYGNWRSWKLQDVGETINYRIIKISQDTEKSPEDLTRLVVTQTRVRNHQLSLV